MARGSGVNSYLGNGNWSGPIDNVQRFEQIRRDAEFLQSIADLEQDADLVNGLSEAILKPEVIGLTVAIHGGKVQVPSIDSDTSNISTMRTFAENDIVYGEYRGMSWRQDEVASKEGIPVFYLCHMIGTGTNSYPDEDGNQVTKETREYVTAASSIVQITSQIGAHDFRVLRDDAFALKIDQIGIDEEMPDTKKLALITRMVGEMQGFTDQAMQKRALMLQRISYMNHLGFFASNICVNPYVYQRNGSESITICYAREGLIPGIITSIGLDYPMEVDDEDGGQLVPNQAKEVMCLEVFNEALGHVSVPVTSETRIFRPA